MDEAEKEIASAAAQRYQEARARSADLLGKSVRDKYPKLDQLIRALMISHVDSVFREELGRLDHHHDWKLLSPGLYIDHLICRCGRDGIYETIYRKEMTR